MKDNYVSELATTLLIYSNLEEVIGHAVSAVDIHGTNEVKINFEDRHIGYNKYFQKELDEVVRKYKDSSYPDNYNKDEILRDLQNELNSILEALYLNCVVNVEIHADHLYYSKYHFIVIVDDTMFKSKDKYESEFVEQIVGASEFSEAMKKVSKDITNGEDNFRRACVLEPSSCSVLFSMIKSSTSMPFGMLGNRLNDKYKYYNEYYKIEFSIEQLYYSEGIWIDIIVARV